MSDNDAKKTNMKQTPVLSTDVETIATSVLTVPTRGEWFIDITAEVARFLQKTGGTTGAVSLFIRHTSASLTIQENADPDVLADLITSLRRLAPADGGWRHTIEGPDDMPAHIKTMLTCSSLQIPVLDGAMALGTWQAIYLIEHRTRPHSREVVMQFVGS